MAAPSLLATLLRVSRPLFVGAVGASLLSGLAGASLVWLINNALHSPVDDLAYWLTPFILMALITMVAQMVARSLFARLGQASLASLRQRIAGAVLAAPFRQLEAMGRGRIQSMLGDDATQIAEFFVGLPIMVTNGVIVLGSLGYLAYLSWSIFAAAVVMIGAGAFGYQLCHGRVLKHLRAAGKSQDQLFGRFESLLAGIKELKLNAAKGQRFVERDLAASIEAVRLNRTKGLGLIALALGWGRFMFMVLIGLALFARLWLGADDGAIVTGYIIVFLYMMGPLEGVLGNLPFVNLAKVAAGRIEAVLTELQTEPTAALAAPAARPVIALHGVSHRYFREREEEMFTLGPIDLTLEPGRITFLVGGNGSGKTTLAKIITGLYPPEGGQVTVNGQPVAADGLAGYRQHFSAVFADFHLFDTLLDGGDAGFDATANDWLTQLHLDHKVTVTNGAFSTRELSQGQRKRLALVAACLEDRPVLVFDEWAADQDPQFKDVFYREILATLKARGKTLLVISHDDHYFATADRIIKLADGRIAEIIDHPAPPSIPAEVRHG